MQLASYAALMKTKKSETDDNNINYLSAAAIICQFMHWLQARFQQKGGVHCNRVNVSAKSYCWDQETARERKKMRLDISTYTFRRNSHAEIDQSLPHPAIRRNVFLSVNLNVQILIAGSSKLLEREKMRFDISTCTSRKNPHVEIDQSLPHPAIRRSVLLSGKCTRTNSYCWVQQTARKRENEIWHQHTHL